jgi:hypothetical protein
MMDLIFQTCGVQPSNVLEGFDDWIKSQITLEGSWRSSIQRKKKRKHEKLFTQTRDQHCNNFDNQTKRLPLQTISVLRSSVLGLRFEISRTHQYHQHEQYQQFRHLSNSWVIRRMHENQRMNEEFGTSIESRERYPRTNHPAYTGVNWEVLLC